MSCIVAFRGLVFYLGREVPREQLLVVIRSFGGAVGWDGEESPFEEESPAITHQVDSTYRQSICHEFCYQHVTILAVDGPQCAFAVHLRSRFRLAIRSASVAMQQQAAFCLYP